MLQIDLSQNVLSEADVDQACVRLYDIYCHMETALIDNDNACFNALFLELKSLFSIN